jgi:hypothetical protein
VAKVHWNMLVMDENGITNGSVVRDSLSQGNLWEQAQRAGADGYLWPPTSGNAWSRSFLAKVLPMPSKEFSTCPDFFLATLAPLYGRVETLDTPMGHWRYHKKNASFRDSFEANLTGGVQRAELCLRTLAIHSSNLGKEVDLKQLRENSRWHQMASAVNTIRERTPSGCTLILVDQNDWNTTEPFLDRRRLLFPERDGEWWGMPEDDQAGINELERLRVAGAEYIVFVWPYLWWLEHYKGLQEHLNKKYQLLTRNEGIAIWDLRMNVMPEHSRRPMEESARSKHTKPIKA